jgi:hypothetical protein
LRQVLTVSTPLVDAYPSPSLSAAEPERAASSGAPSSSATSPPRSPNFRDWLREPLLHFVLLGGALFALDHVLASRADDPHTIVITQEIERDTIGTFKAARGRAPNAEELEALHHVYLDNEVLYREGLALAVDKGDPTIRERVIFKALSVVDSGVKIPDIDDQGLRAWFEAHRDKYDDPARYDFEEAALSGPSSEATVREFVAKLKTGTSGDTQAGLRVFKSRPKQNLIDSYGPAFERALRSAPPGEWQAFETREVWRAMRLTGITGAKPAIFETLRGVVLHDWRDAVASEQRTAAVRALAKKYTVKFDAAAKDATKPAKDAEK